MWLFHSFSAAIVHTHTNTHTSMHKCNQASHLLLLASHVWQSPVSSTKSGGIREKKRGKTSPNRMNERRSADSTFYSVVLWPPKRPWKVLGGTKLQSLRCLWIRGVDRRKSGQQGCSSESGWRYAGGFQTHWKKSRRGRISSHTKAEEQSSLWGEAPSCWGVILGVPQGACPPCPPKCLTKDPEFPLDNKNLLPLNHRGGAHKRHAGAWAPIKGDSSWPLTEGRAGKRAAIYSTPLCCGHGVF